MEKRVIYLNDEGGVCVLVPAPECLGKYTIEEIAAKDVPAGKHFKIVTTDDIPSDRTFRNAWEIDPSILTDGVGAESDEFPAGEEA